MVIVGQDDPASGANRSNHRADHGQRVGNVFEHEPRVRDVKGTPLLISKGKVEGIAMSQLDEILLSLGASLSSRLGKLIGVALDSDDARPVPGRPGHGTRQLGDPTPHVEDRLASLELELAERRLIEKVVQPREPALFRG